MTSYYTEAAVRYYGPTAKSVSVEESRIQAIVGQPFAGPLKWKMPPHEYLVGLDLAEWQADRIGSFTRRFGPLAPRHDSTRKPLRDINGSSDLERFESGDPIWIDVAGFVGLQNILRDAWRGDEVALKEMASGLTADLDMEANPGGLELIARDLWTFIRLLFLRDYAGGKVKVCANPDCATPFFLESRRGNKYCSHSCAVLINVRRFRKREAVERALKSDKRDERR